MAKYKCPSLGDCDKANAGEIFERAPGEDLKCPACATLLELVPASVSGSGNNKMPLIAGAAVVVALLAGGGYYFTSTSGKAIEAAPYSQEAAPSTSAEVTTSSSATGAQGIAPSEAESKELRQASQDKLISGDVANAENVSNKAAANEILKLAIAKMAQGKLDDAEKDLIAARERDPQLSLVSYNLALLRLKQGRKDDAFKEFEACFAAGFNYYDKMDQDPDLDSLRRDPRFKALVAQYRKSTK